MGVEVVVAPTDMVAVCSWEKMDTKTWAIMSLYGSAETEGTY